jgi:glutathione S-transferase
MKLYYLPGACSLASHIALIWSGLDYELERLSYETVHGPKFMALNRKGAVPTLTFADKDSGGVRPLTESLGVLFFIASQAPNARLAADAGDAIENAKLNEMMSELVCEVHKSFVPTFVPDRYVTDAAAHVAVRGAAFLQVEKSFLRLDAYLENREWLVLDRRTVADAYLYVMSRWLAKTPSPVETFPNVLRHFQKLGNDDGVKQAIKEEESPVI